MIAIKVSLGIFFLKIMTRQWQRYVIYAAMLSSTVVGIAFSFFSTFVCGVPRPLDVIEKEILGKCRKPIEILVISYFHGILTSSTDFIFASLSVSMLGKSKLGRREKATVTFILLLAAAYVQCQFAPKPVLTDLSGSIASIARFRYIPQLAQDYRHFYRNVLSITLASLIEVGSGIIAGSLATLRPLFRRFVKGAKLLYPSPSNFPKDSKEPYKISPPCPVSPFVDSKQGLESPGLRSPSPSHSKHHYDPRSSVSTEAFLEAESYGQLSPRSKAALSDIEMQPFHNPLAQKMRFGILPPVPMNIAAPAGTLSREHSYTGRPGSSSRRFSLPT
jgi:hypothetical protein